VPEARVLTLQVPRAVGTYPARRAAGLVAAKALIELVGRVLIDLCHRRSPRAVGPVDRRVMTPPAGGGGTVVVSGYLAGARDRNLADVRPVEPERQWRERRGGRAPLESRVEPRRAQVAEVFGSQQDHLDRAGQVRVVRVDRTADDVGARKCASSDER